MKILQSMSDADLKVLRDTLDLRHRTPADQRESIDTPDEANATLAGATYWTIGVLAQDRPMLLAAGVILVCVQVVSLTVSAVL